MGEMVDRVARALMELDAETARAAHHDASMFRWETAPEPYRQVCRRQARAAIAAMRPTEAAPADDLDEGLRPWRAVIDEALRTMVDAALAD
jgi:hypothetical protein